MPRSNKPVVLALALGGTSLVSLVWLAWHRGWLEVDGAESGAAAALASVSSRLPTPLDSAAPFEKSKPAAAAPATLTAAVSQYMHDFVDTRDVLDVGSAELALWEASHLQQLKELDSVPKTSPALFQRDPEAERGRQLCIEGKLLGIRAERNLAHRLARDRAEPLIPELAAPVASSLLPAAAAPDTLASRPFEELERAATPAGVTPATPLLASPQVWAVPDGTIYFATIAEAAARGAKTLAGTVSGSTETKPLVLEAIAVGDSGGLVDGDSARFCGILTGVTEVGQGSGERRLEHRVVGRFHFDGATRRHSG